MSDTPTIDQPVTLTETGSEDDAGTVVATGDSGNLPKAQLDSLGGENAAALPAGKDVGLDLILDVPVTVTLELGRTTLTVRDLLQLNEGSVVEFDRRVGEPLDLLVNGTLLAHGELVVIDDGFGIRLTEVMSPRQRLEKLN